MHRNVEITIAPEHTDGLLNRFQKFEEVISLSVSRGASVKPPGDVIHVRALNSVADEIMRAISEYAGHTRVVAATSDIASLTDKEHQETIENDSDDQLWEEVETGLRQATHVTFNYLLLMGLGGVISAAGLALDGIEMGIAFVSASIIAPGFEPLAKIPMGLVLKSPAVARRAGWSFLAGYGVLTIAAAFTFWLMSQTGIANASIIEAKADLHHIMDNHPPQNIISFCGALAGLIMIASHREEVIAGAIMALELIPAAALAASGIVTAHKGLFWLGAIRFGIDISLVVTIAAAFIWLKQHLVHRRRAMI